MNTVLFMSTDGTQQTVSVTLPDDCQTFAVFHNAPLDSYPGPPGGVRTDRLAIELKLIATIDGGERLAIISPITGQTFMAVPGAKLVFESGDVYDSGVSIMVVCQ